MTSPVLGFWTLQSWDRIGPEGRFEPYSTQPVGGFLFYAAEGTMAVSIYERHEPRLLTSYAGTFEYRAGEVVHQPIEGSSPGGIQDKKSPRGAVRTEPYDHENTNGSSNLAEAIVNG